MKWLYSALCHLHAKLVVNKEGGATMVEYGLLIGLIAGVCIVALTAIGVDLRAIFNFVGSDIKAATP